MYTGNANANASGGNASEVVVQYGKYATLQMLALALAIFHR